MGTECKLYKYTYTFFSFCLSSLVDAGQAHGNAAGMMSFPGHTFIGFRALDQVNRMYRSSNSRIRLWRASTCSEYVYD